MSLYFIAKAVGIAAAIVMLIVTFFVIVILLNPAKTYNPEEAE